MGEAAEATETPEVVSEGEQDQNPDPMVFTVGEEDKPEEKPEDKKQVTDAKPPTDTKSVEDEIAELKRQNEKLQKTLNYKFANLRQERKKKEAEGEPDAGKPSKFTDAQLLKILEEHKDDPAVMLQVIKHVGEQNAEKASKQAVQDSTINQYKAQADSWLQQNAPEIFDEGNEIHTMHEKMLHEMRLADHPLGDFLAAAAAKMTALPKIIEQIRKEEREKVLAEAAEASRKKAIKGAGPAGGTTTAKPGSGEGEFYSQGKAIGLTGDALKLYVQMRKQAKTQRQVMEA